MAICPVEIFPCAYNMSGAFLFVKNGAGSFLPVYPVGPPAVSVLLSTSGPSYHLQDISPSLPAIRVYSGPGWSLRHGLSCASLWALHPCIVPPNYISGCNRILDYGQVRAWGPPAAFFISMCMTPTSNDPKGAGISYQCIAATLPPLIYGYNLKSTALWIVTKSREKPNFSFPNCPK